MSKYVSSTLAGSRVTMLASAALAALTAAPGAQAYTLLHQFHLAADGQLPRAKLLYVTCGTNGNFLFGTTQYGGTSGQGTVFSYKLPAGPETVIHSFTGTAGDGAEPAAGLIQVGTNTLYGTTQTGGASGMGTVYSIPIGTCTASQTPTVIYSFGGAPSGGQNPFAGLLYYGSYLYGTTVLGSAGGTANLGTVFVCKLTGPCKTLHSFAGSLGDGAYPYAGLIAGVITVNGAHQKGLLGTTEVGGTSGFGTVFGINGSLYSVQYNFAGAPGDGAYPLAELLQHGQDYYTTTYAGGSGPCTSGCGTVFRYGSTSAVTYNFQGGPGDGANPFAGLVWDNVTHKFYGTTYAGGSGSCTGGCGTAFKANSAGVEIAPPFDFLNAGTRGFGPAAGLILNSNTLYGTTSGGVWPSGNGTVFSYP